MGVALPGRSGSGKTTVLRTLAGLDLVEHGRLEVQLRRAVVFQEPRLLPWKRIWRNVALGLRDEDPRGRALEALQEVGVPHRVDAWPLSPSGGEVQPTDFARALAREPELLLLDEPFTASDALTRLRIQGLVSALWMRHRLAVLLVTHDVDEALLLADRALVPESGRIATELTVHLSRPRLHADPGFAELQNRLLPSLGVDDAQPEAANGCIPYEVRALRDKSRARAML
jgi:sulfonate transport system ATP-binding protein